MRKWGKENYVKGEGLLDYETIGPVSQAKASRRQEANNRR